MALNSVLAEYLKRVLKCGSDGRPTAETKSLELAQLHFAAFSDSATLSRRRLNSAIGRPLSAFGRRPR